MDNNRFEILEKIPVKEAIIKLAVPTMIGMIIDTVYTLTDTFFIGKLNDSFQVAAISICFPLFMIIHSLGNLFSTGGASYISRLLGERDIEKAKKGAAISCYSSFLIAIITSIIILIFINPILQIIGASSDTFDFAKEYMVIISLFSFILVLQVSLSGVIRAEGASKEAMIGLVLGTIVNIILDPIFILGLKMGVKGAAIATIIGNLIGVLYYIRFFRNKKSILSIHWSYFEFNKGIYKEILSIGAPVAISNLLMSVVAAYSNIIAVSYSDVVVASIGVVQRTNSMAIMLVFGLCLGFQPIAGYCYGAKNYTRLREAFLITLIYGTIISVFFAVITYIFAAPLIKIFIVDTQIVNIGTRFMRAYATVMPIMALQYTIMVAFQSIGKGKESLIISLGRQGLFYLPAIVLLDKYFGLAGFIWSQPVADIMTTVLALFLFLLLNKHLKEIS